MFWGAKVKITNYLFDFDGTLVNSMPSFINVMLRILDENNIQYEDDIIKIITPLGYEGTASYYISELGLKMTKEELILLMNKYAFNEYAYKIEAKRNVIPTLKALKDKGYILNILTASPHSVLDVCLKRLGIYDLFTNIWSCDDFLTTKQNSEIYKMASQKLNVKESEVLFFDDNINALKSAQISGVNICGVYDESSKYYIDDMKKLSGNYIYDFSEILDF